MDQDQCMIASKKIFVYGDDVDTDRMIAGKYTKTLDRTLLAKHVFEDLDPSFAKRVEAGDFVVAGKNFGCGSSREQAPLALKTAGVSLVIARSFARIFFRNAINIGLPVVELPNHRITSDSRITADLRNGRIIDHTHEICYLSEAIPPFLQQILMAGGLVGYFQTIDINNTNPDFFFRHGEYDHARSQAP